MPAAIALDRVGNLFRPVDVVADDFGVHANETLGPAIALRIPPAELVHGCVGIDANRAGVLPNERARVEARGPAREIVALQAGPEIAGDLRRFGDLFERYTPLEAETSEVRSEGVLAHGGLQTPARTLPARLGRRPALIAAPRLADVSLFYSRLRFSQSSDSRPRR